MLLLCQTVVWRRELRSGPNCEDSCLAKWRVGDKKKLKVKINKKTITFTNIFIILSEQILNCKLLFILN